MKPQQNGSDAALATGKKNGGAVRFVLADYLLPGGACKTRPYITRFRFRGRGQLLV
jgi:hypothetical protein